VASCVGRSNYYVGMSTDRDGTVDDMSEGVFHMPFPPSSGKTGVTQEPKSGMSASTNSSCIADQRPRSGWSKPRIVETSDTFFFSYCIQKTNTYRSPQKSYVYVLDGIATANSGARSG
jgi:hypothetical protein